MPWSSMNPNVKAASFAYMQHITRLCTRPDSSLTNGKTLFLETGFEVMNLKKPAFLWPWYFNQREPDNIPKNKQYLKRLFSVLAYLYILLTAEF
jgi:hypothetical protein